MSIRTVFAQQARACEGLGSPFMGRLCRLFADRLSPGARVADRLLGWEGDLSPAGQSVPLRMAGALHALVLEGADDALVSAYPPGESGSDDVLWAAVERALERHEVRLMRWLDSPPQTNEVRRAAAMMISAVMLRRRFDLPLVVSDLGASAGLNLAFDRFCLRANGRSYGDATSDVVLAPAWSGPMPVSLPIEIVDRAGVDLRPMDPKTPDGTLRLLAYLWPDQADRIARTRAAIALCDAVPETGDAAEWLARRLDVRRPGAVHMVYHTIAWQYFPPDRQTLAAAALAEAGARATSDAPLARMSMEADGVPGSAALTLQVWDGTAQSGHVTEIGRIDYHGRFMDISTVSL